VDRTKDDRERLEALPEELRNAAEEGDMVELHRLWSGLSDEQRVSLSDAYDSALSVCTERRR